MNTWARHPGYLIAMQGVHQGRSVLLSPLADGADIVPLHDVDGGTGAEHLRRQRKIF